MGDKEVEGREERGGEKRSWLNRRGVGKRQVRKYTVSISRAKFERIRINT